MDDERRKKPVAAFTRLTVKTSTPALSGRHSKLRAGRLNLVCQRFEYSWAETAIISDGHEYSELNAKSSRELQNITGAWKGRKV
ncbi:Protein of unknown function [Pyronema omphalodes CBS 100304]|uniref:Uncharacterized protein n=1 Tax=Pyronema omphalodes (strain CBS 100304) TaxID=1076935 RepID=U4LIX7_PYROM|nr:Protein of unknown function [Pyronema omphalodes CBS 100304]